MTLIFYNFDSCIILKKLTMKYYISLILLVNSLLVYSQNDVIYPEGGKAIIRKCTISDVIDGNEVHYSKDSITDVVKAVAIVYNGTYIDLYEHRFTKEIEQPYKKAVVDYDFYNSNYNRAIRNRNTGIILTVSGLCASVLGGIYIGNPGNTKSDNIVFEVLYIGGAVVANVGMILWVSEGIRAANNRKAMKGAVRNTKLSLGLSNNGIGLLLTFNN